MCIHHFGVKIQITWKSSLLRFLLIFGAKLKFKHLNFVIKMVQKLHWRFWRKNSNRYFEMENKVIPISQYWLFEQGWKATYYPIT